MRKLIECVFQRTVSSLPREFKVMSLERWSESVLRYHFCGALSKIDPNLEQSVECGRIDLVLRRKRTSELAFVEFKFYIHNSRYDPWTGKRCGYKGGPGPKNLSEFHSCVERLSGRTARNSRSSFSKYIVLLYYADPETQTRKYSYGQFYDKYKHPRKRVVMKRLHRQFPSGSDKITCDLYEVQ